MPQQKRCRVALSSDSSSGSGSPLQACPDTAEKCRNTVAEGGPLEARREWDEKFEKIIMQFNAILENQTEMKEELAKIRELVVANTRNKTSEENAYVIYGLPEPAGESPKDLEKQVTKLMVTSMKIPLKEAKAMVDVTFRLGEPNQNHHQNHHQNHQQNHHQSNRKGRPVLLKLLKEKHRGIFRGHLSNIPDGSIKIDSYMPTENRRFKSILMVYRKEAKALGQKVKMIGNKILKVDNVYYTVKLGEVCAIDKTPPR